MSRLSRGAQAPLSDELLSAYIDNRLSDRERQRVERALQQDQEARQRLQGLEATVRLLRQMPEVAPPRAFVLSEAQVLAAGGRVKGAREPGRFGWFSRLMPLATAAVAVALMAVLGLDMLARPQGAPALPAASQAPAVAAEAPAEMQPRALRAEAEVPESAPPPVETTREVAKEVEGAAAAEPAKPPAPEVQALEAPAEAPAAPAEAPPEAAPAQEAAGEAAEEAPPPAEEAAAAISPLPTPSPSSDQAAGEVPAAVPLPTQIPAPPPTAPAPPVPAPPARPTTPYRTLELTLAALFIVFLVITLLVRRRPT